MPTATDRRFFTKKPKVNPAEGIPFLQQKMMFCPSIDNVLPGKRSSFASGSLSLLPVFPEETLFLVLPLLKLLFFAIFAKGKLQPRKDRRL
ncbi:MAG: hypothetical protein IJ196_04395 [Prevotella sp.]|nr:hypothetical protein [Prevotella sp.]